MRVECRTMSKTDILKELRSQRSSESERYIALLACTARGCSIRLLVNWRNAKVIVLSLYEDFQASSRAHRYLQTPSPGAQLIWQRFVDETLR
jgi:hypothetical protein